MHKVFQIVSWQVLLDVHMPSVRTGGFMRVVVAGWMWAAMALLLHAQPSGRFEVADEFLEYMKSASNPDAFGLRENGRFYPYSPPGGRRIAYRQRIQDKAVYRTGWAKEEAEAALRAELEETAVRLAGVLSSRFGLRFHDLSPEGQEILVDFGYTEGADGLNERLVRAVAALDWATILEPAVYIRYEADWPDTMRNRAFFRRWGTHGGFKP